MRVMRKAPQNQPALTPINKTCQRSSKSRSTPTLHRSRKLMLAIFALLGAMVTGGLANLIFNGWFAVLSAILGGFWSMSLAAIFVASRRNL